MMTKINLLAKKEKNGSVLDAILSSRGITNKEEYFNPQDKDLMSPYVFSDMEKAVNIIKEAISNKDKILIWGDFDADGVTSTSILYKTFMALGANFSYFIPDRLHLGHGINLKELLKRKSKENIKLLITVDCGIANIKEVSLIKSMGVKVIITDHHEQSENLPSADCILNPVADNSLKRELSVKEIEDVSHLSGAGVAYFLSRALLKDDFKEVSDEVLSLSAIGTIADVVPLVGENRKIAAKGLVEINNGKLKGVKKLFKTLEFDREITSEDIAFLLAPRINAAGRLDLPEESFRLLVEDNDFVIQASIEKLNNFNKIRQSLCEKTFQEALSMLNNTADSIVLYNPKWHVGIIGIVASKLVEKFNLPVFLITEDDSGIFRCSARGTTYCNISKVLKEMKDVLLGYGGHALAGGFSASSNEIDTDELINKIKLTVSDNKNSEETEDPVNVDIELDENDITFELFDELKKMEPFGANNEKPTFLFRNARVISQRTIGKDYSHLSYSVMLGNRQFECLYWKRKILGFDNGEEITFVFRPEINEFNGEKRIQLLTEFILNDRLQENYFSPVKFFDHRQKTGIMDKINDYVKTKAGEVKVFANSIPVKKSIDKYPSIKENILIEPYLPQKTVMFFEAPPSLDELKEFIKSVKPSNIHFMKFEFSKNPDDYLTLIVGMLKFASKNKGGEIDISALAKNAGLNETCIQIILEILEKLNSVQIESIDRINFIKAPSFEAIHNDSMFEILKDELEKVFEFKEYIKNSETKTLEMLFCN